MEEATWLQLVANMCRQSTRTALFDEVTSDKVDGKYDV